ncbi:MAG: thymidine kinase [Candidatus Marinimicrobia bacterium]|jgi:thymidine kinase|nr:thymidine kinase [Candidatus Neomarinimicrobiota bacterium]MBT3675194.1 thymidine kinase [Candidatus Neomarinimicrobiota bacterium]MBT3763568.1 thymidine kinase [Candidatus Neomarinimicrobiota bacterium]MBT4069561.1 thymidine kinase [Candidatus Neomarinimicrobiota bacterium]MBT4271329.1 thymidine kinase [Candidatus Neomarinimicrobiota bacterium]
MTLTPKNAGWIEVICGSMFSGKTEELIRRIRRAEIAKMKTIIFKPQIDDRYSSNHVVSHNQSKLESRMVKNAQNILDQSDDIDVIGIDEAQFFSDEIIDVCKKLAKNNKRVVVAGLDTDYRGIPFGPMPALMCEADYLDKFRAICIQCGNPASCSQRITKETGQVVIGEADIYEARCRNCFEAPEE